MKKSAMIKTIIMMALEGAVVGMIIKPDHILTRLFLILALGAVVLLAVWEWYSVYVPLAKVEELLAENESSGELMKAMAQRKRFVKVSTLIQDVIRQSMDAQGELFYAKQVELAALQSQINPHFLYNSLDTIRGQAMVDGNREVAMMIKTLSSFFRYSISRTAVGVTLRDELDNVRNYLKIQQYRFGERFHLEIEVEEQDAYDFYVPRLILQPVVENAIGHGLADRIEGGVIQISVDVTDDLFIVVSDNGAGMSLAELDALNQKIHSQELSDSSELHSSAGHAGIALTNIQKQIEMRYGKPYGIRIYSSKGRGTEVEIVLPIQRNKEGSDIE